MISLFLLLPSVLCQQFVSVPTTQGTVQGKTVNYGNDRNQLYYGQADVFLGIPYAQAPVGDLRFQAPQPMRSYPQPVYDATYYRPKCPQSTAGSYMNEDCLYLNVFTQQANQTAAMAVMVFVDGGDGLTTGGTDQTQLKGTVRNLVSRGVVVVSFQYRLGALGFFSTTAMGFQSNNGMLDQVLVLQWVQQNIASFGGDPNKVTLAGQGDGACAVSAHTLSPLSQNLFQQAIIQSGTINSCYSDDGTTAAVNEPSTTALPVLQRDQGLPYAPLDQSGQYNGYYSSNQQQQQQQQSQNYGNQQQQGQNYGNQQQGQSFGNQQQPQNYGNQQQQGQNFGNQQWSNGNNQGNVNQGSNSFGYNGANAQYDQAFVNPSQQLAQQLCNISSSQWNSGNVGDLKSCLNNYSVDFIVQTQGKKVATWLIVRDNYFLPDSPERLASRRPPIPIIIGTVQDEDADYAFKLVANGNATNESEGDMLNNWMVDFARKNKVDPQAQNQIENVIAQNYNVTPTPVTTTPYSGPDGQRIYDYTGRNENSQLVGYNQGNQGNQQQNTNQQYYQPSSVSQQISPTTATSLRTMSTITSDAGIVSQTATEIDSFTQNGNTVVRIYQFTYVTNLGRQGQPQIDGWKPVTKGTDQIFLFMSETVWTQTTPTAEDRKVADQIGERWTQFAKEGQVNNWQPTTGNNYNYCDLSTTATQKSGYGEQARQVFQQQVQPIVQQSQQQQGIIQRDPTPPQQQQYPQQQYYPQPQQQPQYNPGQQNQPPQAQYQRNGDSSSFQISFTLQNALPYYG